MSARTTEDTRDEEDRFRAAYAALDDDAEDPAAADQAEPDDADDPDAADPEDRDDDEPDDDEPDDRDDPDDDEAEERRPRERRPSESPTELKRQLNQAHAELGRLRPLREQAPQLAAQTAALDAQVRALTALLDQRDRELVTTWEQAAEQAADTAQRSFYAAEAARRKQQFASERERLGWESQRTAAEAQQRAAAERQVGDLEAFVRQGAERELRDIIAREAKRHGLGKEERRRLTERIQTREFAYLVTQAPGPTAAQAIAAKAQELVEAAAELGRGRAGANRAKAQERGTYRAERPVRGAPQGRPSQQELARRFRNSGDMAGYYAELQKHGYL